MRRSLFACSVLALTLSLALTVSACQQDEPSAPETAQATTEGPAEAAPGPTQPVPPATTPTAAPSPVSPPAPAKEPQASIPEGPDMAPRPVPVSETSCRDSIGEAAAARLVERCIQVSPATRPPCNAANPCALIQNEIDRSCKLWEGDGDAPAECRKP